MVHRIELQVAAAQDGRQSAPGTAAQGAQPRDQLDEGEGLGQVIVGAQVEAVDPDASNGARVPVDRQLGLLPDLQRGDVRLAHLRLRFELSWVVQGRQRGAAAHRAAQAELPVADDGSLG